MRFQVGRLSYWANPIRVEDCNTTFSWLLIGGSKRMIESMLTVATNTYDHPLTDYKFY